MTEKIMAFILLVLVIRALLWLVKLPFRLLARATSGRNNYVSSSRRPERAESSNDPYYEDLYEVYYGRRPAGSITEEEMCELDEFEYEEWDEDDCC